MFLLLAGATGTGLVWGWLAILLAVDHRGSLRRASAVSLMLATPLFAAEIAWLAGVPALVHFLSAAALGCFAHAGLRRWLHRRAAPVG